MTHEELLEKFGNDWGEHTEQERKYRKVIYSIVELHKPITIELCDDEDCCGCGDPDFICSECQSNDYPCPTIQAIEKALQ